MGETAAVGGTPPHRQDDRGDADDQRHQGERAEAAEQAEGNARIVDAVERQDRQEVDLLAVRQRGFRPGLARLVDKERPADHAERLPGHRIGLRSRPAAELAEVLTHEQLTGQAGPAACAGQCLMQGEHP